MENADQILQNKFAVRKGLRDSRCTRLSSHSPATALAQQAKHQSKGSVRVHGRNQRNKALFMIDRIHSI